MQNLTRLALTKLSRNPLHARPRTRESEDCSLSNINTKLNNVQREMVGQHQHIPDTSYGTYSGSLLNLMKAAEINYYVQKYTYVDFDYNDLISSYVQWMNMQSGGCANTAQNAALINDGITMQCAIKFLLDTSYKFHGTGENTNKRIQLTKSQTLSPQTMTDLTTLLNNYPVLLNTMRYTPAADSTKTLLDISFSEEDPNSHALIVGLSKAVDGTSENYRVRFMHPASAYVVDDLDGFPACEAPYDIFQHAVVSASDDPISGNLLGECEIEGETTYLNQRALFTTCYGLTFSTNGNTGGGGSSSGSGDESGSSGEGGSGGSSSGSGEGGGDSSTCQLNTRDYKLTSAHHSKVPHPLTTHELPPDDHGTSRNSQGAIRALVQIAELNYLYYHNEYVPFDAEDCQNALNEWIDGQFDKCALVGLKRFEGQDPSPLPCIIKFAVNTAYKFHNKDDSSKFIQLKGSEALTLTKLSELEAALNKYPALYAKYKSQYDDREAHQLSNNFLQKSDDADSPCGIVGIHTAKTTFGSSTNTAFNARLLIPVSTYSKPSSAVSTCDDMYDDYPILQITSDESPVDTALVGQFTMGDNTFYLNRRSLFSEVHGLEFTTETIKPKQKLTPKQKLGVILGSVFGGLALIAGVGVGVFFYLKKKRSSGDNGAATV